jgi:hypothetical protein
VAELTCIIMFSTVDIVVLKIYINGRIMTLCRF